MQAQYNPLIEGVQAKIDNLRDHAEGSTSKRRNTGDMRRYGGSQPWGDCGRNCSGESTNYEL